MIATIFFLSSGLFLGWSLGANDASNVFGAAVTTKMVRFRTAAWVCAVFVILGAVFAGSGTTGTLGQLGAVNALPGAFTVAFAAAFTVFLMTRSGLPVSTSQAIVGAIIGWNIFAGLPTDFTVLGRIVATWVASPVLAAAFAAAMYFLVRFILKKSHVHLVSLDTYTRAGLLAVGAFGSYSLGASNIANVMGVFVPVSPFKGIHWNGFEILSGAQLLFLLGGIAIATGVFTYSRRVMETVGSDIFRLSPLTALVVVLSSASVLFLFASGDLKALLDVAGLPSLPLVPLSSSQTVVGAVIGIGLAKSGRNIHLRIMGRIGLGWVLTPLVAGLVAWVLLFFMRNVFLQEVVR